MIQLASLPANNNLTQENQDIKFNSPEPTWVENDAGNFGHKDGKKDGLKTFPYGDRFERGGIDLLEYTAHQSLDFHKTIQDSHRAEEYAQDYSRLMGKLNNKWQEKELARLSIEHNFSWSAAFHSFRSPFKKNGKGVAWPVVSSQKKKKD